MFLPVCCDVNLWEPYIEKQQKKDCVSDGSSCVSVNEAFLYYLMDLEVLSCAELYSSTWKDFMQFGKFYI